MIKRFSPVVLILSLSCLDPYYPAVDRRVLDMLVVKGFMNATDGTATVKLSHVLSISDPGKPTSETGASVSIEASTGGSHLLTEQDSGRYSASGLTADKNTYYTLRIKTRSGTDYVSDTIRVKDTPPIDSLSFGISNNGEGLTILVNTHDPSGKTWYYSWDYSETYEYRSVYYSGFKRVNGIPRGRFPEERIDQCWLTVPSTTISIATSVNLSEDVIHRYPLTIIPKNSPKIEVRYSILVKQRALGIQEYNYLDQLGKTTENLGSIFGPAPTTVVGNIHPVNESSTPVLGYFSGAEVKEKRFFIERLDLPERFRIPFSTEGCHVDTTCNILLTAQPLSLCVSLADLAASHEILVAISDMRGNIISYTWTEARCADCRLKGGTTQAPEFW